MKKDLKEYIKNRVLIDKKTGCWDFTGYLDRNGYGKARIGNKIEYIHRVSYKAFIEEIEESLIICHKCDNPRCCNPLHLFKGTHKDNSNDKIKKGRLRVNNAVHYGNNYRGIPVLANNKKYKSVKEASRDIGISDNGIRKRIKTKKNGYMFLKNEDKDFDSKDRHTSDD
jgi:hypothetical protein